MAKKILLIDGNALVHRSFHALPPLTAPDGTLVNAVYGFFSTLLGAIIKLEPDYCLVAFDVSGGTFRDDLFDQYKAKRAKAPQSLYDQFPIIKSLLTIFEIPAIGVKGFEADDVIGTMAEKNNNLDVIIVTGDQDAIQLINDTTRVFTMRHGLKDTVLMDRQAVIDKYGFPPEQMVEYKALRGDPSDNIPGVPGIGDKTACQLLKDYQTIEHILEHFDDLPETVKKKIKGHEAEARLSKTLATIRKDVPIDFDLKVATLHDFDQAQVEKALTKLGMKSLIRRLPQSTRKVTNHIQGTLL